MSPEQTDAEIVRLAIDRISQREIGRLVGRSAAYVNKVVKANRATIERGQSDEMARLMAQAHKRDAALEEAYEAYHAGDVEAWRAAWHRAESAIERGEVDGRSVDDSLDDWVATGRGPKGMNDPAYDAGRRVEMHEGAWS